MSLGVHDLLSDAIPPYCGLRMSEFGANPLLHVHIDLFNIHYTSIFCIKNACLLLIHCSNMYILVHMTCVPIKNQLCRLC